MQPETPTGAGPGQTERPGFESALRGELAAVLAGREFSRSPTLTRLLRFLVSETIAGNGDRLKAYSIAVDGLGRPPDYDAQHDSYPRVQMVRLRKALELHYAETAPSEGLAIHVTAGSYRVRLAARERAYPQIHGGVPTPAAPTTPLPLVTSAPARPGRTWRTPLAALVFAALLAALALALWRGGALAPTGRVALTSPVVDVVVQGPQGPGDTETAAAVRNALVDGLRRSWALQVRADAPPGSAPADYAVRALVIRAADGSLLLSGQTIDNSNGMAISSGNIPIPADPGQYRDALSPVIAGIGGPYGQIVKTEDTRLPEGDVGGYPCLLRYSEYNKTKDPALGQRVGKCLAMPVPEPRLVASVLAARAFYVLQDVPTKDPSRQIAEASEFARRAMEANADDPRALFAMARLAYIRNDCAAGNYYTGRSVAANANDPYAVTILSGLSYLCGYPQAGALYDRAMQLRSDSDLGTRATLILAGIAQNRLDAVVNLGFETRPARPELLLNYLLCQTLVSAAQGRNDDARRYWQELRQRTANLGTTDDDRLRAAVLSPVLRAKLLGLMRERGITDGP